MASKLKLKNNQGDTLTIENSDVSSARGDLTIDAGKVYNRVNDVVSVKDFGAKGDGITDDTTAIQNAINYLSSGGELYFPNGTYILSSDLRIDRPITVKGASLGSFIKNEFGTIIKQNNTSANCFTLVARQENYEWGQYGILGVKFSDLKIVGNSNASRSAMGIGIDTTVNGGDVHVRENILENVNFQYFNTAIEYTGIAYLNDFINVSVTECSTGFTNQKGNASDNGGQTRFFGCSFTLITDACVRLQVDGASNDGSFSFVGCTLSEAAYGIVLGEQCQLHISGCELEGNTTAGIYVEIAEANPNTEAVKNIIGNKFLTNTADIYINKTTTAFVGGGFSFPMYIQANVLLSPLALKINVPSGHTGIDSKQFVLGASNSGSNNGQLAGSQISANFLGYDEREVASADMPIGAIVGTTDTQTLTNKTFQGTQKITNTAFQDVVLNMTTASGTTGTKTQINFQENNGITKASITGYNSAYGSGLDSSIVFRANGADIGLVNSSSFSSRWDDGANLGGPSNRWSTVYAATGTINTSDDREKTYIDIADIEKQVALEVKANMKKFKFNDAIEVKGENDARIHFGTSAQTVKSIFEKHGLVAEDYALFCYDEWEAEYETVVIKDAILDEDGNIVENAITEKGNVVISAGNRYGIRYEELLCFIISAI